LLEKPGIEAAQSRDAIRLPGILLNILDLFSFSGSKDVFRKRKATIFFKPHARLFQG